jgi:hypothetical protein
MRNESNATSGVLNASAAYQRAHARKARNAMGNDERLAVAGRVLHVRDGVSGYQLWLNRNHDFDGLLIGRGRDRAEALEQAITFCELLMGALSGAATWHERATDKLIDLSHVVVK